MPNVSQLVKKIRWACTLFLFNIKLFPLFPIILLNWEISKHFSGCHAFIFCILFNFHFSVKILSNKILNSLKWTKIYCFHDIWNLIFVSNYVYLCLHGSAYTSPLHAKKENIHLLQVFCSFSLVYWVFKDRLKCWYQMGYSI